MLPFWLYTLGRALPSDGSLEKIEIPFLSILQTLAALMAPLLIGALIKYKLPRVAKIFRKGLKVSQTNSLKFL